MIPKLYSKAHQALNSGDEELSYIYFMRCLSVILCLKESPDFQTFFNYYRAMYAKEANDCMAKLQELDASLRARWEYYTFTNLTKKIDFYLFCFMRFYFRYFLNLDNFSIV